MKTLRVEGPVALEPHIEDPKSSAIFAEYPRLINDQTLIHLICDTLRLVVVSSGTLDPHAVEDVMDNSLKTHHHEAIRPAHNLQGLAAALPRSEERRVGNECVRTCRFRWSLNKKKKKTTKLKSRRIR